MGGREKGEKPKPGEKVTGGEKKKLRGLKP